MCIRDRVPVLAEGDVLTELGQAVREKTGLKLLLPGEDSPDGIWVRVAADGTLIEVQDLASLAGHGWAWKYPDHNHNASLHLIRGAVRNVPGEDYYLTELKGAVRFSHVDFSYVPGKRILHDVSVYANPGQKIAFVGSTGAGKTTITNLDVYKRQIPVCHRSILKNSLIYSDKHQLVAPSGKAALQRGQPLLRDAPME